VKLKFWLLDINPKIDDESVEVWLWGIDSVGNRVLVVDRRFVAYFYAVLTEGADASNVAKEIISSFGSAIVKTQIAERRFFGKPVKAIKIYCKNPKGMEKVSGQLRRLEGVKECLEDDIRVSMRYLIDNNVVPCSWLEVEAEVDRSLLGVRASKVYATKSAPWQLEEGIVAPSLRTLGFSMLNYSPEGSPKPDRNPVIIISTVSSNGEEKQFIASDGNNDKPVIEQFVAYVQKFDPDVIVSFGGNSVDWNYLTKRSRKLKMAFDVDRACKEPHTSIYGHVSFTGIANVDLVDFMDVFPEVKVRTLWNLSAHLGIKTANEQAIEDVDYASYWDDPQKRDALKRFSLNSARKVYGDAMLLLDFAMQLSSLVSLPLDHVMTAAVGFRVEWFLIRRVQKIGELIPKRLEQPYLTYAGGLVLTPKAGLHEDIAVLDFKSMYPNIMITYNLSPDTYIAPDMPEPPSGVNVAPEVEHKFRRSPPGFYKEALTFLIDVRNQIRSQMKTLNPKTVEHNILDARQKAVKIITNAAYGYAGWVGARWYIKPVAEAASAWGRHTILTASQMAEAKGLNVVYGDTDSLFLTNDKKELDALQKEIKLNLALDVEVGEVYKRIFFTEAKKRYAGLRADGSLDIVGLEVIRGDWAEVAKKVQEHVLEIILKEQSPKKAVDYVHTVIAELKQNKIPLHDLVIWKTLTKPIERYAIKTPHVEAAKMLKEKGWRLTGGDKIGYVILKGKGRLYNRVKPYIFASYEEIDVDYYVTNQVVPAAARILSFFDVTEEQLLSKESKNKETKSLMDFMKT
jgi:DNA polymerase, archaea type